MMVFTAPFDKPSRREMECTVVLYSAWSEIQKNNANARQTSFLNLLNMKLEITN